MRKMPIDESLAFTSLLEMDPVYRGLASGSGESLARRDALLGAWYAQDEERNFWQFTKQWLADEGRAGEHSETMRGHP